jgi:DNA-binding NarL/FixJ family response regulator
MSKLRVFIVEDSPVIRENLIATLEELVPLEVVACAEDGSTARFIGCTSTRTTATSASSTSFSSGSGSNCAARCATKRRRLRVVLSNYATADVLAMVPRTRCRPGVRQVESDRRLDRLALLADGGGGAVAGALGV